MTVEKLDQLIDDITDSGLDKEIVLKRYEQIKKEIGI